MTTTDELLTANARAAADFTGGLAAPPSRRVAVVTCMDARIDTYAVLGLRPGEAHVLRNAGGVVTDDVVRSLVISQRRLGTTEIVLAHHSGCGMSSFTDDELADELAAECGQAPPWRAGAFVDPETDVRAGMAALRDTAYLPHREAIRGFVLDIETGALREVT